MVADILTKALPREAFEKFCEALEVVKISQLVEVLNGTSQDQLRTPSIAGTIVNLILSSFYYGKFL